MARAKLNQRGWIFMDVLTAMMIVAILAGLLGAAVAAQDRALHHLADSRAAMRLAESTLISLQAGDTVAPAPGNGNPGESRGGGFANGPSAGNVTIRQLSTDSSAAGMVWVQVQATVNGRHAALVGLVPRGGS